MSRLGRPSENIGYSTQSEARNWKDRPPTLCFARSDCQTDPATRAQHGAAHGGGENGPRRLRAAAIFGAQNLGQNPKVGSGSHTNPTSAGAAVTAAEADVEGVAGLEAATSTLPLEKSVFHAPPGFVLARRFWRSCANGRYVMRPS
jgi:hypothetical protein